MHFAISGVSFLLATASVAVSMPLEAAKTLQTRDTIYQCDSAYTFIKNITSTQADPSYQIYTRHSKSKTPTRKRSDEFERAIRPSKTRVRILLESTCKTFAISFPSR